MAYKQDDLEQIFETCLAQVQSGQESMEAALARYPQAAEELRPRLEAALWLGERKDSLEPRPGFVTASRSRLVSQIKQETTLQTEETGVSQHSLLGHLWRQLLPQGPGLRRKFVLQLALIVIFLFSTVAGGRGIAVAAQDALPGDTLYPVKIALERAEMITTINLAEEIRLHVEFANRRLDEVKELVLAGRYAYIPQTLANFGLHVNQAVNKLETLAKRDADQALAMAVSLHASISDQAVVLQTLMGAVPLAMQPDISQALDVTAGVIVVVEDVGTQSGGNFAPTSTAVHTTESVDTDEATSAELPTVTPGFTPTIIDTPTPEATLTPGPSVTMTPFPTTTRTLNPTITSTSLPSGGGEEPTAVPDEPEPPSEPDPTKKPKPDPTRRPPKPTKENNNNNNDNNKNNKNNK